MEKLDLIKEAFEYLRFIGIVKSQKEFAKLIGTSENSMSRALKGDESYLTPNLITKVESVYKSLTFFVKCIKLFISWSNYV